MEKEVQIEQVVAACTWRIRQQVLYPQGHLRDVQVDGDFDAVHFGAYHAHRLIGVVSLFEKDCKYQFRKFAVLPDHQQQGVGSSLMRAMLDVVQIWNGQLLWCNARIDAAPFYEKFGLSIVGQPFNKNQIDYVRMEKALSF
ncbi:GNAT family N-acetyltransferase [Sphingobacterium suaedae]|uniref:GNAT family N-acetyltransferase n=1 Tax=Sphingobacterium suaedae TaxID=1686402 RepID=A0ABW5KGZ5_9SPHI